MKLIVGLGNPEPDYSWTRHNVGKEVLTAFFAYLSNTDIVNDELKWFSNKKLNTSLIRAQNFLLAKPYGFMNDIGKDVSKLVRYYKINYKNLLIVYDELDLTVGEYKMGFSKSSRIHNGILSVVKCLGTKDFWHFRVGIRDENIPFSVQKSGRDPSSYVLQKFSISHRKKIEKLIDEQINKELLAWLSKKE